MRTGGRGGARECAWGLLTLGSPGTGAFVGIDQVNAGAPILARLGETFIDLVRAVGPHISRHALKKGDKKQERGGWRKKGRRMKKKRGRGRREGNIESMGEMKQLFLFFLFTWLFFWPALPRTADPSFQKRLA